MTTRRHVQRQLERNKDLRDNALYYAASGESLAVFTAALAVQAAHTALCMARRSRRLRGHALVEFGLLIDLVMDAHDMLEPFRGRVCLGEFDKVYELLTELDEDGGGDDDDDVEAPKTPTPVPAAFSEVFK